MHHLIDLGGLLGFAVLCYGLWSVYPPAAAIVGGALLLLGSCSAAANLRRERSRKARKERHGR